MCSFRKLHFPSGGNVKFRDILTTIPKTIELQKNQKNNRFRIAFCFLLQIKKQTRTKTHVFGW
jgi:hypothetical protein